MNQDDTTVHRTFHLCRSDSAQFLLAQTVSYGAYGMAMAAADLRYKDAHQKISKSQSTHEARQMSMN